MARQTSAGKCNLCSKTFSKTGMTRHLMACLRKHTPRESGSPESQTARRFHLAVAGTYASNFWMHLDIAADATLADLDQFLRDTWLECCWHLSAFEIGGLRYNSEPSGWLGSRDMHVALGKLLHPKMQFGHQYDFGSTTHLTLKVASERKAETTEELIKVLARNDPLEIPCDECGENVATEICTMCVYDSGGWLCDTCISEHTCGEDYFLPVVNSPRVGVCGYTG